MIAAKLHKLVCGHCGRAVVKGQDYYMQNLRAGGQAPVHETCMDEGSKPPTGQGT